MSPESTHKLMGFYMEVLILSVIHDCTLVHGFCFFELFSIRCIIRDILYVCRDCCLLSMAGECLPRDYMQLSLSFCPRLPSYGCELG